jgi:hypothetical protein
MPATADSQKNRRHISQSYVGMSQQDFNTGNAAYAIAVDQKLISSS